MGCDRLSGLYGVKGAARLPSASPPYAQEDRPSGGVSDLAMLQELIKSKPDILRDLPEQNGRDIAALMERHRRAFAFHVAELLMRTALAHLGQILTPSPARRLRATWR